MDCKKLCKTNKEHCNYCQKTYIVSNYFYKAKRPADGTEVKGYLVQDKKGKIEGILNSANDFNELAYIIPNTLSILKDEKVPILNRGFKVGEYNPEKIEQ